MIRRGECGTDGGGHLIQIEGLFQRPVPHALDLDGVSRKLLRPSSDDNDRNPAQDWIGTETSQHLPASFPRAETQVEHDQVWTVCLELPNYTMLAIELQHLVSFFSQHLAYQLPH